MPLSVCRVGARWVHVAADVHVKRPESRRSAACQKTWEYGGPGSGGCAVAAAGVVAWGR